LSDDLPLETVAYAYLFGIGVMLIGGLVLVVCARPQPEAPRIDP
jgi:hypothetical protein